MCSFFSILIASLFATPSSVRADRLPGKESVMMLNSLHATLAPAVSTVGFFPTFLLELELGYFIHAQADSAEA